jgi:long-chain acyl-CoA synthetase
MGGQSQSRGRAQLHLRRLPGELPIRSASLYPLPICIATSATLGHTERDDRRWRQISRGAAALVTDTEAERSLGMRQITTTSETTTLCQAFQHTVASFGDRPALRTVGGHREMSWSEYGREVSMMAATMAELGVGRGDTVALMMANRIEFHVLDTAAMHLGAIPVSIYNTLRPTEIAYILENSGAALVFAENVHVPSLLEAGAQGRRPIRIVDIDGNAQGTLALADAKVDGSGFDAAAAAQTVRPDDLATISYTSGTTGIPKGVELSHRSILRSIRAINEVFGTRDDAVMVSILPMAHVAERIFSHWRGIVHGFTVTPCSHPSEAGRLLLDARPHYVFSPPRLFEKLRASIEAGFERETDRAAREAIDEALRVGAQKIDLEQHGEVVPDDVSRRYQSLQRRVFAPALARVGLDRVEVALTGSAPVPPELVRQFLIFGLPIYEGWGMSEITAFGAFNRPGDTRVGTVGYPLRGAEIRLADDGELLFRSEWLMTGYRGNPGLTAETIDDEGWLHTGDIAAHDADGRICIVDRKKELIISAFGKNMAPSKIEFAVKNADPLVGQICVIGDAQPFVTALIVVDPDIAVTVSGADRPTASAHPAVAAAVERAVATANDGLSRVEQIKKYRILDAEWLPGGDELSPTMKLKRKEIARKYAKVIDELYDSARSTDPKPPR